MIDDFSPVWTLSHPPYAMCGHQECVSECPLFVKKFNADERDRQFQCAHFVGRECGECKHETALKEVELLEKLHDL